MWAVAPGFSPRAIEGRLTLARLAGTTEVLVDERMVSGDSDADSETSRRSWVLEPEQVVPGLTYSVELFETTGTQPDLEPARAFPPNGAGDLGIDGTQMRVRVVAIPVTTPGGGGVVNEAAASSPRCPS
jgi:hypothetical protein